MEPGESNSEGGRVGEESHSLCNGSAGLVLNFPGDATVVSGYCDAEYAGDVMTRRSTSGILAGVDVSWQSTSDCGAVNG